MTRDGEDGTLLRLALAREVDVDEQDLSSVPGGLARIKAAQTPDEPAHPVSTIVLLLQNGGGLRILLSCSAFYRTRDRDWGVATLLQLRLPPAAEAA